MKIVHYVIAVIPKSLPENGRRACVFVVDHPDFPKGHSLITSPISCFDEFSGVFVTENTCYIPAGQIDQKSIKGLILARPINHISNIPKESTEVATPPLLN